MRIASKLFFQLWCGVAIVLVIPSLTCAQTSNVQPRITAAIDESQLTMLRGNTHPLARPEYDRGAAPSSQPMRRMMLVLRRSSAQETALEALLEQQQDASSANFHQWLTPVQFGLQFGPADQDIQTITAWLQSHGFQIAGVSNGRTVIEFSGTAGQIQEAFHTSIHSYVVKGEQHWANSSDPQIPTALAPVVAGLATLHNFPRQQMHEVVGVYSRAKATGTVKPDGAQFTFPNPCNPTSQPFCDFAVAPADFAKIYDVPNLLLSPAPATQFNGDNVTIAIVSESDVVLSDVSSFRSLFGLPAAKLNTLINGPDPGLDPGGTETEADLDVELAGGVAPNATIDLVVSQTTEVSLGADLSAQYAVDNNLAPILNESYGICEFHLGTAGNTFYDQLWQQAAAQGITVTVSSGDSGSAVCNRGPGPATYGLAVSGFTSTPYNVSVGGTDFNDVSDFAEFWNTTPSDTPTVASALGYIAEMTWNNTCTNQEIFNFFSTTTAEQTCNIVTQSGFSYLVAVDGGSGGASNCITSDGQNESSCSGAYQKPAWQTALTPHDGTRDVPDVSLFASDGFNSSFYLICEADFPDVPTGATSCDPNAAASDAVAIGGTSASSPAFAAIMALVNQATSSRQGNPNPVLYKLAAENGNTCTSAAKPASTCMFYDIPSGSTIAMACVPGSPNCTVTTSGDQYGVLSGYATSSGYDLATGLGSVNAANLITKWKNFALTPSSTTLALTPPAGFNLTNLKHGQSVGVNIDVTGNPGTPSGNVSLVANEEPSGTAGTDGVQGFILSGSGAASGATTSLPGGTYTVFAQYPGDGTFGSSASSPAISVTVAKEASKTQIDYELFDPSSGLQTNPNATTAVFGTPALLRVNVTSNAGDACAQNAPGQSGCPTGSVTLTDSYNGGAATPLNAGSYALNIQGYAEDQVVDLAGGSHNLTVTYAGDNSYTAAPPGTSTLTINPVPTSTALILPGFSGTPVFVTGQQESLTTTIGVTPQVFTAIAPTGTVTYFSGSTPIGTASVVGRVDPTTHFATAGSNILTSSLPHGQDSLTAHYSGDASYSASTSPVQVVADLYQTNVTVSPSSPSIPHNSPVTLTATVTTTQAGAPAITGTVNFLAGQLQLGSAALTNGQAQITTSALPVGAGSVDNLDVINATYSGDANFVTSSGNGDVDVTLLATTTALTTSNPSVQQGASVTLTATVTAAGNPANAPALTGTVQFTYCFLDECGVMIGGPVTLANGVAQVTTTSLQANTNQVTATYSGDTNYVISAASIAETVNPPPDFQLSSTYNTVNVGGPGNQGTMTLNVSSVGGFSGTVTFTSCTGLPAESSCSFSPPYVTVGPNMLNESTLVTISTTAPSVVGPDFGDHMDIFRHQMTAVAVATSAWLVGMLIVVFRYRGINWRWGLMLLLAACVFVGFSVGCGGGSGGGGGGGGGGGQNSGTPVGSDPNGVITATSGSTSHTFDFGIDVESH